jgi:hypothetical protein
VRIIHLGRKPLEGSVASNVLEHGAGALNVDATRVSFQSEADEAESKTKNQHGDFGSGPMKNRIFGEFKEDRDNWNPTGRWPANLVLEHRPECRCVGTKEVKTHWGQPTERGNPKDRSVYGKGWHAEDKPVGYANADGKETVAAWSCVEGCPVAALDEQSGADQHPRREPARGLRRGQPLLQDGGRVVRDQVREFDLTDPEWGVVKLLVAIPKRGNPWGVLSCLKGTVWEQHIQVVSGESYSHAMHGWATPLMREIGVEPRVRAKRISEQDGRCRLWDGCLGVTPGCRPGPDLPGCYEAPLADHDQSQAASIVALAWEEGRYVLVVEGAEFSI